MAFMPEVPPVMNISISSSDENLFEEASLTQGNSLRTDVPRIFEKKASSLLNKVQFVCGMLFIILAVIFTIISSLGLIAGLPVVAGVCIGIVTLCIGVILVLSQIYFNGKIKTEKQLKKIVSLTERHHQNYLAIDDLKTALKKAVTQMDELSDVTPIFE
ncbi:MAG: hypothetical protein RRZ67_04145 [Victivallaceae bacterium]